MEWLRNIRQKKEIAPPLEILKELPSAVVLVGIECSGKTSPCKDQLSALGFSRISFDDEFEKAVVEANRSSKKMIEALTIAKKSNEITVYYPKNKDEFEQYFLHKIFGIGIQKISRMVIEGKKASLDGINILSDTRISIVKALRKQGVKDIACIWIDTPVDECLKRFRKRGSEHSTRELTEDILRRHASQFEPPTASEGFDSILRIPFKI
ncbi:MAG: hypothetical protein HW400_192 [Candidatus Levybacteria bacterium]|nr:hypothetical protein [Candidatus Levybacteria bacterium]